MAADVMTEGLYSQLVQWGASFLKENSKKGPNKQEKDSMEALREVTTQAIMNHFQVDKNENFYRRLKDSKPQELESFKIGLRLFQQNTLEAKTPEFLIAVDRMVDTINSIRNAQLLQDRATSVSFAKHGEKPADSGSGGSGASSPTFSLEAGLQKNSMLMRRVASYLELTDFFGKEGFIDEALKYNTLRLTHHDLSNVEMTMDEFISYLKKFRIVRALVPPRNLRSEIDDAILVKIAKLCPNLESLDLSGCKITNDGIKHIKEEITIHRPSGTFEVPRLEKLRSLNLSGCKEITGEVFVHLSKLVLLEDLDVSYLDPHIIRRDAPFGRRRVRDEHLAPLSELSNLRRLNLCNSVCSLTNEGLTPIAKLEKLTHLCMSGKNSNFNGLGLRLLTTKLKNLTYLDVVGWRKLVDDDAPCFIEAEKLTHLFLGAHKSFTTEILISLSFLPNLTDLALLGFSPELSANILINDEGKTLLSRFPKLRRLNVYASIRRHPRESALTRHPFLPPSARSLTLEELKEGLRNSSGVSVEVIEERIWPFPKSPLT